MFSYHRVQYGVKFEALDCLMVMRMYLECCVFAKVWDLNRPCVVLAHSRRNRLISGTLTVRAQWCSG